MPLAIQAVLPLAVLLLAALVVLLRQRQPDNGWIACAATALAAAISLVELLRLAPGEHVDVTYLSTFPFADLAIRLDGLSLAFLTITLTTAALLMLLRQQDRTDRRDPWLGWLLTSASLCALILAANLLLLYVLLQLLTLSWSGALDEAARRRRGIRLSLQIGDIGLLLAAASAVQSVGTSSFSGVPSDTFGVPSFLLMLLPVVVRIGALALGARRALAAVAFGPALACLAPAAYVLLRLLALMAGRLPDRPTAVCLFGAGTLGAIALAIAANWAKSISQVMALLLAAQVALALALSSGNQPVMTVASTWLWLLLIPLAGLVSVRMEAASAAEAASLLLLAMVPGSVAFLSVWLTVLALNAGGLGIGLVPIGVALVASAATALARLRIPLRPQLDLSGLWGGALLLIAAVPMIVINPLVLPAAATVRAVPGDSVSANPLGLTTSVGDWPALLVSIGAVALFAAGGRLRPAALRAAGVARG